MDMCVDIDVPGRILRGLAANGAVIENSNGYTASPPLSLLANTEMAGAYGHWYVSAQLDKGTKLTE